MQLSSVQASPRQQSPNRQQPLSQPQPQLSQPQLGSQPQAGLFAAAGRLRGRRFGRGVVERGRRQVADLRGDVVGRPVARRNLGKLPAVAVILCGGGNQMRLLQAVLSQRAGGGQQASGQAGANREVAVHGHHSNTGKRGGAGAPRSKRGRLGTGRAEFLQGGTCLGSSSRDAPPITLGWPRADRDPILLSDSLPKMRESKRPVRQPVVSRSAKVCGWGKDCRLAGGERNDSARATRGWSPAFRWSRDLRRGRRRTRRD